MKKEIKDVMEANGLTEDTILYRETLDEYLGETPYPGLFSLSANDDPSEAVIDEYEGGYLTGAAQIGPGLAFAESRDNQWKAENRTTVAVRLGDVLSRGGRVYPVESVITEKVWYLTMPEGKVVVRKV